MFSYIPIKEQQILEVAVQESDKSSSTLYIQIAQNDI
jgi:hypothetical protein